MPVAAEAEHVGQGRVGLRPYLGHPDDPAFCRKPDGTVPDMGARLRAAQHLGGVSWCACPRMVAPGNIPRDPTEFHSRLVEAEAWVTQ